MPPQATNCMDKSKDSAGVLYKIADCVRTAFVVRNRRSARTVPRPRKIETLQQRDAI